VLSGSIGAFLITTASSTQCTNSHNDGCHKIDILIAVVVVVLAVMPDQQRTTHTSFTMTACYCLQNLESKIVDACAGMPLVLELAGGRLRYKRDTDLWQVGVIVMILLYEHIYCQLLVSLSVRG
jgi:hypothetical protein